MHSRRSLLGCEFIHMSHFTLPPGGCMDRGHTEVRRLSDGEGAAARDVFHPRAMVNQNSFTLTSPEARLSRRESKVSHVDFLHPRLWIRCRFATFHRACSSLCYRLFGRVTCTTTHLAAIRFESWKTLSYFSGQLD